MSKFKLHEIALLIDCSIDKKDKDIIISDHEEVEISAVPAINSDFRMGKDVQYYEAWHNNIEIVIAEHQLRKKQPPQKLSSWEDIQQIIKWHPNKVEA